MSIRTHTPPPEVGANLKMRMRIVVTGAGGFVGRLLVDRLIADGHEVVPIVRTAQGLANERVINDIGSADWPSLLIGADAVIHLAARVHMMHDPAQDPLAEFRRINVDGTRILAEAASRAGVRRFLFLSSIKVNGESTQTGRPFRPTDPPQAVDDYGLSKQEAETALFDVARSDTMTVTIIRPALIYGPGMKGNLRALLTALRLGIPLPLGRITANRRSMVGVDNLASLISIALRHPAAANAVFLAADGEDLSTAALVRTLAAAIGRKPRLLPVPAALIRFAARMVGRHAVADRLIGNLQVDIADTRATLGWSPPVSVQAGLRTAVQDPSI